MSVNEEVYEAAWVAFRDSNKPAIYNQIKDAVNAALSTINPEGEQISAARAKAVKFISEHDPFGDVFSQRQLQQIEGTKS